GAIQTLQALVQLRDPFPLRQQKQLFRNVRGTFETVTSQAGAAMLEEDVSRGAAFGDIDNDGDTDVVVANNNGPLRLLMNRIGNRRHWLGVRVIDASGRDAVGSRVAVVLEDGSARWR